MPGGELSTICARVSNLDAATTPQRIQRVSSPTHKAATCHARFLLSSRTPNDEKCGTRNLHAHTLGAESAAGSSTPLHAAAKDASIVRELLSKE